MVTSTSTRTFADDVREIDDFFRVLVARIDPDAVPLCEVIDLYAALETVKRRAESTMLLLARKVEDAGRWKRDGKRSAADQIAGITGTSVSTAKSQLETSKKVAKLPATAKALRKGKLSAAKAEAIAAAATVSPDDEDDLLDDAAELPLAAVKEKCLRARAKDRDAAHARIRKARSFKDFTDQEGAWNVSARGTLDAGAAFRAAHRPIVDEMFNKARAEGRCEPYEAYAFDALIELARRASNRTTTEATTTTEPATTAEAPTSTKAATPTDAETADAATSTACTATTNDAEPAKAQTKAKAPAQYVQIIRIDGAALRRGWVEGEEVCEIVGLGPVPVSVAREQLGDAVLKLVITNGVDVANVTHLGRSVTVAQQVALWWLSPECTRLGCTRTQRLQNDHREDWVRTKHTRLDESDPLCGHDHDLKTYRGWALVNGNGKRPMVPPHDPRHPKKRPPP